METDSRTVTNFFALQHISATKRASVWILPQSPKFLDPSLTLCLLILPVYSNTLCSETIFCIYCRIYFCPKSYACLKIVRDLLYSKTLARALLKNKCLKITDKLKIDDGLIIHFKKYKPSVRKIYDITSC